MLKLIKSVSMDIAATKLELIQWLIDLKDEKLIARIQGLRSLTTDWWDHISDDERQAIEEGLSELDRGEGIPHEQVMKEIHTKFSL